MGGAIDTALTLTTSVTTLAGSGAVGSSDATGAAATFSGPQGITTYGEYAYVSDTNNNKIRSIHITSGAVSTLAGSGAASSLDGTGAAATFNTPIGITTDGANLYVADYSGRRIRRIVIATGVVTTLAGSGTNGSADGTGVAATFGNPSGITTDGTNLFVSDAGNHKIRKITISSAAVSTLAGTGSTGSADNTGILASFNFPNGLTILSDNLYVADGSNHRIRKIVIATGVTTTFAGNGTNSSLDGTGTSATFNSPVGITNDGTSLYVSEYTGCKVRRINASTQAVTTVAGSGTQASTNGTGTAAAFNLPYHITADTQSLILPDSSGHRVRRIQ